MTLQRVLNHIAAERSVQDDKWGGATNDDAKSPHDWFNVIADYNGWARNMAMMSSHKKAYCRYLQIASLAAAAAEAVLRREGGEQIADVVESERYLDKMKASAPQPESDSPRVLPMTTNEFEQQLERARERGKQEAWDQLAADVFERGGFATLQLNPVPGNLPRIRFIRPDEARPVYAYRASQGAYFVRESARPNAEQVTDRLAPEDSAHATADESARHSSQSE